MNCLEVTAQAVKWLTKAASKNNPEVQYELGKIF